MLKLKSKASIKDILLDQSFICGVVIFMQRNSI